MRGSLSSLRLFKLSDKQARAYQDDISDPSTKRVIVVNDGSTDFTADVVRTFAKQAPEVRLIENPVTSADQPLERGGAGQRY